MNQRWLFGRDSYRPSGEPIQTHQFEVAEILKDGPAKQFVLDHHYSQAYVAARFRFGLYKGGNLVGVAVFSHPCNDAVLTNVFPCPAREACELGRFVLLDSVPANGETWFLGRCFEQLKRKHLAGVVSFSDPSRRTNQHGETVFGGHIGRVYQAHNAVYLGRGTPRKLNLFNTGVTFSDRAREKLLKRHSGWKSVAEQLISHGAKVDLAYGSPEQVKAEIKRICRVISHQGNFKYAWGLTKATRKHLGSPKPAGYPKSALSH